MRRIMFTVALITTFFSSLAFAALPPKYLSVPDWQSCVGNRVQGKAEYICLPAARPDNCPMESWKMLVQGKLVKPCGKKPSCGCPTGKVKL